MGKSIRSKREKRLRSLRRKIAEPFYDAKDEKKQSILDAIVNAPSQYTLHVASQAREKAMAKLERATLTDEAKQSGEHPQHLIPWRLLPRGLRRAAPGAPPSGAPPFARCNITTVHSTLNSNSNSKEYSKEWNYHSFEFSSKCSRGVNTLSCCCRVEEG